MCSLKVYPLSANMQLFLLLMTGKGSSSRSVIFLLDGNHSMEGMRHCVFNGLIALEKAATGNAVIEGNITWRCYWQQEKVKELA